MSTGMRRLTLLLAPAKRRALEDDPTTERPPKGRSQTIDRWQKNAIVGSHLAIASMHMRTLRHANVIHGWPS
jgi:hypothetical protein